MTTMAALLGGVPLMLGTGSGSELRQPLGYAMVGGLALSQLLDPVHDAGDLSLSRPAAELDFAAQAARAGGPGGVALPRGSGVAKGVNLCACGVPRSPL